MFLTFNMGIGYLLVMEPEAAGEAAGLLTTMGERVVRVGEIVPGGSQLDVRVVLEGPA